MNGAVNIANQSGVKILPFAISSYKIDLNRWDNGTVTIKSLPPVTVDNLDRKGVKMVTRQLRQDMKDCIDNMDKATSSQIIRRPPEADLKKRTKMPVPFLRTTSSRISIILCGGDGFLRIE